MKKIPFLILIIIVCSAFFYTRYVFHKPDFARAKLYTADSIYRVEEYKNGQYVRTPQDQSFISMCDYEKCWDSVATYIYYHDKESHRKEYARINDTVWKLYINGVLSKKRVYEKRSVDVIVDKGWDIGDSDFYDIHWYKTEVR